MIITDFDGVLFNDYRFKRDYKGLLTRLGISSRMHQQAYQEAKTKHASCTYRHDTHLAIMKQKMPSIDTRAAQKEINRLVARSAEYLYRDARPFLSYWRKKGESIALVSSGFSFQKKKVRASGLLWFFRRAIVTGTALKVEPVQSIVRKFPREFFVFMDDRRAVTDAIKKLFPFFCVIQVIRRKEQERSVRADAIVKNLAEARTFCAKAFLSCGLQKEKSTLDESRR